MTTTNTNTKSQRHDKIARQVTADNITPDTEKPTEYSWEISYQGGVCKFESPDPKTAVIYHLQVPENIRNQGIGTALLKVTSSSS